MRENKLRYEPVQDVVGRRLTMQMTTIIRKIWNDPVGSKVIGGIILGVLGLLYVKGGVWFGNVSIIKIFSKEITLSVSDIVFWSSLFIGILLSFFSFNIVLRGFDKIFKQLGEKFVEKDIKISDSQIDIALGRYMYEGDFYKFRHNEMFKHFGDIIHRANGNFAFSDVLPEIVSFYRSQGIITLSTLKPYPDCFVLTSKGNAFSRLYFEEKYLYDKEKV